MASNTQPRHHLAGNWATGVVLGLLGLLGLLAASGAAGAQTPQEDAAYARKVFGDVNAPRPVEVADGETKMLLPLEIAAARGDAAGARMLRALVAAGARVDARDPEGRTAIHVATMFAAVDNLRVLAELGADVNARDADGDTPLHIAAGKGQPQLVATLVALGADPRLRNKAGQTPVLSLLTQADPLLRFLGASPDALAKIVSALLTAGADPDAALPEDARTGLMLAVVLPASAALPLAQAFLSAGADPNRSDRSGRTALHHAIEAGTGHGHSIRAKENASVRVVRLLLAAGADPNHRDRSGRSPLFPAAERACSYGPKEAAIFDALLASGADPRIRDGQARTALDVGGCAFLRARADAASPRLAEVKGERIDLAALTTLPPDARKETVIGIIRRILARDVDGRRKLRPAVAKAVGLTGLTDRQEAQARAALFSRYLDHVLGVVTWKEEGPQLVARIGKKLSVALDAQDIARILVPAFGTVPDGSQDRALRAEYYWTESWRDIFQLLAQTPDGWRPGAHNGGIAFTDRQLADRITKLQEDARIFATAFAAPPSP